MLAHPPAVAAALVLGRTPTRDVTMCNQSAQQRATQELQAEAMACFELRGSGLRNLALESCKGEAGQQTSHGAPLTISLLPAEKLAGYFHF